MCSNDRPSYPPSFSSASSRRMLYGWERKLSALFQRDGPRMLWIICMSSTATSANLKGWTSWLFVSPSLLPTLQILISKIIGSVSRTQDPSWLHIFWWHCHSQEYEHCGERLLSPSRWKYLQQPLSFRWFPICAREWCWTTSACYPNCRFSFFWGRSACMVCWTQLHCTHILIACFIALDVSLQ